MVSGDTLAEWCAINAHNYRGSWVVLRAEGVGEPLAVVVATEDLRGLRGYQHPGDVAVHIPRDFEKGMLGAADEEYRTRAGQIAPRPEDRTAESDAFDLGRVEGLAAGREEGLAEANASFAMGAIERDKATIDAYNRGFENGRKVEQGRSVVIVETPPPTLADGVAFITDDEVDANLGELGAQIADAEPDRSPGHAGKKPRKKKTAEGEE